MSKASTAGAPAQTATGRADNVKKKKAKRKGDDSEIFVKMNNSRTFPLHISAGDKVDDVIRQIQSEEDMH